MKRQGLERSNSRHRSICLSGIAVLVAIAGSIAEGTQSTMDDGGLGDSASASVSQPQVDCSEELLLRSAGVPAGISEAGVCAAGVGITTVEGEAGARARRLAYEMARLRAAEIVQSLGAESAESTASPQRLTLRAQANLASGQIQILDACVRSLPSGEVECGVVALYPANSACDAAPYGRPLDIGELQRRDESGLVDMLGVRGGVDEDGHPVLIAFGQSDAADEAAGGSPSLRAKAAAVTQLIARCAVSSLESQWQMLIMSCAAATHAESSEDGPPDSIRLSNRDTSWDGIRRRSTMAGGVLIVNFETSLDWQWTVIGEDGSECYSGGVVSEGWRRGAELLRLLEKRRFTRTIRQWSCKDPITGKELHGAIMAITKADLEKFDLEAGLRSDETSE